MCVRVFIGRREGGVSAEMICVADGLRPTCMFRATNRATERDREDRDRNRDNNRDRARDKTKTEIG